MADYNVQSFTYTNPKTKKTGTTVMYGYQSEHNHNKAAQFTPDAINWIVAKFHWPKNAIEKSHFASHQGRPGQGHELKWNDVAKRWM